MNYRRNSYGTDKEISDYIHGSHGISLVKEIKEKKLRNTTNVIAKRKVSGHDNILIEFF